MITRKKETKCSYDYVFTAQETAWTRSAEASRAAYTKFLVRNRVSAYSITLDRFQTMDFTWRRVGVSPPPLPSYCEYPWIYFL